MGCGATELLPTPVSALNFSGHTRCHHIPASSCLSQSIGEFTELVRTPGPRFTHMDSPFPRSIIPRTVFVDCTAHEVYDDAIVSQMGRRQLMARIKNSARPND